PARAPSPTSCATGSSRGSATGASPSRCSISRTAASSSCPRASCRSRCPSSTTSARRAATRRRSSARPNGSRRPTPRPVRPPRDRNTMPNLAGRCWYYLRFCDPHNERALISPEAERYWMPVDLYVGGAEHAVLHLLYARFWHKVLYDLGVVHTKEPFQKLVNQ